MSTTPPNTAGDIPSDASAGESASGSAASGTKTGDPGYAKRVLHGSVWMIINTVVTRAGSFVAQIFLAWWLTTSDFGLVGVALALSGFFSVLRDGGVRQILLKQHNEHDRLLGPCFWMAMGFNVLLAVLLTLLAFPFASLYDDPRLIPMLLIIGWSIPLGTPGGILLTKLLADMRYRENASVMTASAMTRYVSSIAFAYAGLGALSFVLPNILCALVENAMAYRYCRHTPWRDRADVSIWWDLFKRSRWALVAILGISGINQGAGAAIGLAAPLEIVGIYTFTFLIVVQVGSLLSTNINQVLVPVFTRLAEDESRKRDAVLRTLRQVSLLATMMALGLAATYRPFEAMIWRERWEVTVTPVHIVGAGYAINVLIAISLAVQQARGQFRAWGLGLFLLALGTMGSAALGAWLAQPGLARADALALLLREASPAAASRLRADGAWWSAVSISLCVSVFGVLSSLLHVAIALKPLGVRRREVIVSAVQVWMLGLIAGAATVGADATLGAMIRDTTIAWLAPLLPAHTPKDSFLGHLPGMVGEGLLFALAGVLFVALFTALLRLFQRATLLESLRVVPGRFRGIAAAVLLLPRAS